jgi:hypothetical protein
MGTPETPACPFPLGFEAPETPTRRFLLGFSAPDTSAPQHAFVWDLLFSKSPRRPSPAPMAVCASEFDKLESPGADTTACWAWVPSE